MTQSVAIEGLGYYGVAGRDATLVRPACSFYICLV